MRTFVAIVRDTLIALRRRRLFWLHLWLSVGVVFFYAGMACHDNGWSLGFGLKNMASAWLKAGTPWENTLHCWTLAKIMRWWVAGGAVILALFSTAAVLPETLEPGRAALVVPRARRRGLILAGGFAGSLGYLLLQTALVVAGLWLALGWRLGIWHHPLWLAVPLAALLYAPLQAVAMLLGVLTRSAAAAVLVAILFAGSVWAIQGTAAPPEDDDSSAAVAGKEEGNGTAISDAISSETARQATLILPNPKDSLLWLERRACPLPARRYRDLFQQLRIGHSGLSAAAADAIAREPVPAVDRLSFAPLLAASAGFTVFSMMIAAWLLKRRDL